MGYFSDFSRFWPFWPKIALFPGSRDPARGGFYINPSRRGPAVRKRAFSRGSPGRAQKGTFGAIFGEIPDFRGFPAPGPRRALGTPAGYRGAPARGVDVKPPLARGPGDGSRGSRSPLAGQGPWKGLGAPPEASGGHSRPLEGPGTPSRGPRSEGFTSTPRGGAPRFPGATPGSGGTPPPEEGLGRSLRSWFVGAEGPAGVDWRGLARRDVSYGRDKDCSEIFKVLLLILCAQPSWTRTSLYRMWSATACPRDARPELRSLGGSPLAPSGVYPRPSGTGHPGSPGPLPDPRREPRGPGARGWCKTPARDRVRGGPRGLKRPQNREKCPKWAILAILAVFGLFGQK